MMRILLTILIIGGLAWGGWRLYEYYQGFEKEEKDRTEGTASAPPPSPQSLPGLVPALEPTLEASRKQGAVGLKNFLARYGHTIRDPRLADIQLDYVVLVARDDPAEARRVFAQVKQRTPAGSPVLHRVQQLEKTFE